MSSEEGPWCLTAGGHYDLCWAFRSLDSWPQGALCPVDVRVVALEPWLSQDEIMGAEVCDVEVARGLVATEGDGVVANLRAHAAVCKLTRPWGSSLVLGSLCLAM